MAETQSTDELIAKISAHKVEAIEDALVSLPSPVEPRTDSSNCVVPTLLATTLTLAFIDLCYCAFTHLRKLLKRRTRLETFDATVQNNYNENIPHTRATPSGQAPTTPQLEVSSCPGYAAYAVPHHSVP